MNPEQWLGSSETVNSTQNAASVNSQSIPLVASLPNTQQTAVEPELLATLIRQMQLMQDQMNSIKQEN